MELDLEKLKRLSKEEQISYIDAALTEKIESQRKMWHELAKFSKKERKGNRIRKLFHNK